MIETEFIEVTKGLEKFYGKKDNEPKELNSTEFKIWFDELKKFSKERYRQIAREAVRTCRYMPSLAEILIIEKTIPKEKNVEAYQAEYCSKCNSTGIRQVFYQQDGIEYSFGCRCVCLNGNRYSNMKNINNYQTEFKSGKEWLL